MPQNKKSRLQIYVYMTVFSGNIHDVHDVYLYMYIRSKQHTWHVCQKLGLDTTKN